MNRKIWIGLIVGFASIILLLFLAGEQCGWFRKDSNFVISNTDEIISFSIIGDDTLLFRKTDDKWTINNTYTANNIAIENFFYLFQNIEVTGMSLQPGSKKITSRKIKVTSGRKNYKFRYYPFPKTPFIHHEGSKKFYNISIKGVENVNINKVLSDQLNDWVKKTLVNLGINDVKSIKVNIKEDWGSGFYMESDSGVFKLYTEDGKQLQKTDYDQEHIIMYAAYFQNIPFDSVFTSNDTSEPGEFLAGFSIQKTDEDTLKLDVYAIKKPDGSKDMYTAFCTLNNENQLYSVPYVYLDPLFMTLEQFLVE